MPADIDVEDDGPRTWRFVPCLALRDRDERTRDMARRVDALRSAIGLVRQIDLRWETGPAGGVVLAVSGPRELGWIARCLLPAYPGGAWRSMGRPLGRQPPPTWSRFGVPLRPSSSSFPADLAHPWADAVMPALGVLPAGIRLHWTFRPGGLPALRPTTTPGYDPQPAGLRLQPLTEPEREARDRQERRRREPLWVVCVALEADNGLGNRPAAERLARIVESASARGGENRLRFVPPLPVVRRRPPGMVLSEAEVAAILPGPDTRVATAVEAELAGLDPGIALGKTDTGQTVRLSVPGPEGRHLAILGETGMGKSSALLAVAVEACHRGGVVLLDPIGDTGRALLAFLGPEELERTVWISPTESPVAVDLIASIRRERVGAVAADRALGDVVDALRRVRQSRFSETPFWGPRIEETVRRTLAAAAALPGGTLQDAERLLAGVGRRPTGIPPEAREAVEELWQRARDRPDEVDGSRRLLGELTGRPALARMLSAQRPRFSPSELSAEGRIVVITAEAAQVGEVAARYLLAVHLALFWSARLALPRPPKTFLLLEEAQWYAHESVAEMLRLGRRANLHLYLATQALGSLSEPVADAVRTNSADFLVFRGAPDDARELARWSPQVDPIELLSLPRGRALLLRGKGALVTPVAISPAPAPTPERILRSLALARNVSRPHWPDDEPVDAVAEVRHRPSGSPPLAPERFRDLWLVLWAAVLDGDSSGAVRIPLRRLRAAIDPDGARVREAGRYLRATGVITDADRDPDGAWWEVDRSGISGLLGPGAGTEELAEATRRWRSTGPAEPSVGTQPS